MRPITLLARADLSKAKGGAVSLAGFVALTAAVLNLGLMLAFDYPKEFDRRAAADRSSHLVVGESAAQYSEAHVSTLGAIDGVTAVETQDVVYPGVVSIAYNDGSVPSAVLLADASEQRDLDPLVLLDGAKELEAGSVYLPSTMRHAGGYEVGDRLVLDATEFQETFTVAGFTDEVMLNAPLSNLYRVYIDHGRFESLLEGHPDQRRVLLSARLADPSESVRVQTEFTGLLAEDPAFDGLEPDVTYYQAKQWRTLVANIVGAVMVAFAAVIAAISLIVIRFKVRDSIEDGARSIGVLKALGYTSGQIGAATATRFGVVALVGSVVGTGLSYAALPAVSAALVSQSALTWSPGFMPVIAFITLVTVVGAVLAVTGTAALRVRRLTPLAALRAGLAAHSFRHDPLPLSKTRWPLNAALGLKWAWQSKGQMAMTGLVVVAVGAVAAAVTAFYWNVGAQSEAFFRTLGGEIPDGMLAVRPGDAPEAEAAAEAFPEVRKAFPFIYESPSVRVDDAPTSPIVAQDFSELEGTHLYEGRFPKHANEAALWGGLAEASGKQIGDTVTVTTAGGEADFLVTGLINSVDGDGVALTAEGIVKVLPDFQFDAVYVYLDHSSGVDADDFLEAVAGAPGSPVVETVNVYEVGQAQLEGMSRAFGLVALVVVLVVAGVIGLVLHLVASSMVLRRRRQWGVSKAVGFTDWQLARQVSAVYLPTVLVGLLVGSVVGTAAFPAFFGAVMRSVGIYKAFADPSFGAGLLVAAALAVFAGGMLLLVGSKIRRVGAYGLISE
jgi:putative ABC transport system permease protein